MFYLNRQPRHVILLHVEIDSHYVRTFSHISHILHQDPNTNNGPPTPPPPRRHNKPPHPNHRSKYPHPRNRLHSRKQQTVDNPPPRFPRNRLLMAPRAPQISSSRLPRRSPRPARLRPHHRLGHGQLRGRRPGNLLVIQPGAGCCTPCTRSRLPLRAVRRRPRLWCCISSHVRPNAAGFLPERCAHESSV